MSKQTNDEYDYDDDFEEVDEYEEKPIKTINNNKLTNQSTNKPTNSPSNTLSNQSNYYKSDSKDNNTKRIMKYGGSITINNNNTLDPRYRRLERLKQLNIYDLQDEKFINYTLLSSSKYDLYNRYLRSSDPVVKQVGIPNEIETREIETSTDELTMVDKELQYNYGDDTVLHNMIQVINNNRSNKIMLSQGLRDIIEQSNELIDNNESNNLLKSLQKTSYIIESLLDETSDYNNQNSPKRLDNTLDKDRELILSKGLFNNDFNWRSFNFKPDSELDKLIGDRNISLVKHSDLQPHILLTAYPSDQVDSESSDNKSIYCIWDVNSNEIPLYTLESTGLPSSVAFSSSQSNIVSAGTFEGCLYMWDLRESAQLHSHRSIQSNQLVFRKPSYSSHQLLKCHESPVIRIESLKDQSINESTNISQFVSLDTKGLLIFWVSSAVDSSSNDLGCSPWSQIKLLTTRLIDLSKINYLQSITSYMLMSCIPNDLSTYLIADVSNVYKIVRFGSITTPYIYTRSIGSGSTIDGMVDENVDSISYHSYITCMNVSTITTNKLILLLVGRSDGSIDLFNLNHSQPIYTWNLSDYEKSNKSKDKTNRSINPPKNIGCVSVHWIANRVSAFITIDSNGTIYLFDLLIDFYNPIVISNVSISNSYINSYYNRLLAIPVVSFTPKTSYNYNMIDVSICASNNKSIYLSIIDSNRSIKTNKLKDEIQINSSNNNEIDRFIDVLDHWIGRIYETDRYININK